jgi:hypothetical protein
MVHQTYDLFLALYLAHLLGDFVLQTDKIAAGKKTGHWRSYLLHGLIHYADILIVVWTMNSSLFWTRTFQWVALSLCVIHLLLDWTKSSLTKAQWIPDNVWTFIADQVAHLATIACGAFIVTHPPVRLLAFYLQEFRAVQNKCLLVAVIYVLVVFGGGYFIRYLIAPPLDRDLCGAIGRSEERRIIYRVDGKIPSLNSGIPSVSGNRGTDFCSQVYCSLSRNAVK